MNFIQHKINNSTYNILEGVKTNYVLSTDQVLDVMINEGDIEYNSPYLFKYSDFEKDLKDKEIIDYIDVLVDGKFDTTLKDYSLKWKGSSNQRVIDIQESLKQNKVVLYKQ